MTFEKAREIFLNRGYEQVDGGSIYNPDKWRESIIVISDWLQQEPCEDAISRQAVLEIVERELNKGDALFEIEQLTPVTSQSKTGHWIEHPHEAGENWEYSKYECSECHVWENDDSDYCPNCGAKMVKQQESEA